MRNRDRSSNVKFRDDLFPSVGDALRVLELSVFRPTTLWDEVTQTSERNPGRRLLMIALGWLVIGLGFEFGVLGLGLLMEHLRVAGAAGVLLMVLGYSAIVGAFLGIVVEMFRSGPNGPLLVGMVSGLAAALLPQRLGVELEFVRVIGEAIDTAVEDLWSRGRRAATDFEIHSWPGFLSVLVGMGTGYVAMSGPARVLAIATGTLERRRMKFRLNGGPLNLDVRAAAVEAVAIVVLTGGAIAIAAESWVEGDSASRVGWNLAVSVVFFAVVSLRLFYFPWYIVQYRRAAGSDDPFVHFYRSPVYWDEAMPVVPWLRRWLLRLVDSDRERGLEVIGFVGSRNISQYRASRAVLNTVAARELGKIEGVEDLTKAKDVMDYLPLYLMEYMPIGIVDVRRRIESLGEHAAAYLNRVTPDARLTMLRKMREEIVELQEVLKVVSGRLGKNLQRVATGWGHRVIQEESILRRQVGSIRLSNPFIVGNPLSRDDVDVFKGRKDAIAAIEAHIVNAERTPALFLHGQRRMGKTSILLGLPRLLGNEFVPVFIDLQEAMWREGDAAFCFHLVRKIVWELVARVPGIQVNEVAPRGIELIRFERYPFTMLDLYLDRIERSCRDIGKCIVVALDEYEKLDAGLKSGKITIEILNQLRNIIQHRREVVVLVSGRYRLEDLEGANWTHYLINTKTIEVGVLPEVDARELLTEPVPDLKYEESAIDRVLYLSGCQPYLVQAIAFQLVKDAVDDMRLFVQEADVDRAADEFLRHEQAYFSDAWRELNSEEQRMLKRLVVRGQGGMRLADADEDMTDLLREGIVKRCGSRIVFAAELFRMWAGRRA